MTSAMISILKGAARRAGIKRDHVAKVRMAAERHALAVAAPYRERDRGRILCYHCIGYPAWGVNDVSPRRFRRQIEVALDAGYSFVPAREIATTGGKSKDLAITFDDGHFTVFTQAAPILKDYGIPFSVFIVSEWSEKSATEHRAILSWDQVGALVNQGAEIGSHSATHPDFGQLDPSRYTMELEGSRQAIERQLGFAPDSFAIPLGQSGNWATAAREAASLAGYRFVYAQAEETRPQDTIARTFVTAFDHDFIFRALLRGAYDEWEEWF
jgi:peptidoglycan/xylan/chitin deacetylase (PgdA/CDA1 family)